MIVYDSKRQPLLLGKEIGHGGEATVYRLAVQPTLLAKIYSRPPLAGYDQKLGWMAANPPDDPTHAQGHASIAWPRDLIYDEQRRLVGYVMAYVQNAAPILTVFNPRLRARTLPNFDHRYLYRTARNLAAALGALHASNYVVGDLNESNVMVTPSALVTLIDTDSFQVQRRAGAKPVLHPCPVGKPEYTPPELQGKSFQHTARLPEHDRFGLAVLIFQLLMEGNHPFRAQWLGAGDPPPIEARIRDGGWPYAPTAYLLAPPRYTPGLNTLPPPVVDLVRHCFVEGHRDPRQRPAPHEWERALAEAEKALMPCGRGHYYPNHLRECLQCQAQQAQQARRPTNESAQSGLLHEHAQPASPFSSARPWPYRRLFSIGFSLLRSVLRSAFPIVSLGSLSWPLSWVSLYRRPMPVTVACSACGHMNALDEVYCQKCARRLFGKQRCTNCRHTIPLKARYCPHCGARV